MTQPVAIIDLDNCISNDKWRLPKIRFDKPRANDRYVDYHESCYMDIHENQSVIDTLRRRYRLVVFTARPEIVRTITEGWLRKWRIPYEALFMRPNDDHSPSVEMKKKMLGWLPAELSQVEHAIDDRHDILDMYRAMGVCSTQRVFIYEPEIKHP